MFSNRAEAGRLLADRLKDWKSRDAIIMGIPRGGVVVAAEISKALKLPLSLMIVRKIGAPTNPELAIGAIGTDGKPYFDAEVLRLVNAPEAYVQAEAKRQFGEVKRRMGLFGIKRQDFRNKVIILVDDGIATGATVKAAIKILRSSKARKIILAVPVCSAESARELEPLVDRFVCLEIPPAFSAVGQFYADFREVTDSDVKRLLQ